MDRNLTKKKESKSIFDDYNLINESIGRSEGATTSSIKSPTH